MRLNGDMLDMTADGMDEKRTEQQALKRDDVLSVGWWLMLAVFIAAVAGIVFFGMVL